MAALVLIPLLFGLRMIAALVATAAGIVAAVAVDPSRCRPTWRSSGLGHRLAVVGIALGLLLVATATGTSRRASSGTGGAPPR